jgi:hypothetical protein
MNMYLKATIAMLMSGLVAATALAQPGPGGPAEVPVGLAVDMETMTEDRADPAADPANAARATTMIPSAASFATNRPKCSSSDCSAVTSIWFSR